MILEFTDVLGRRLVAWGLVGVSVGLGVTWLAGGAAGDAARLGFGTVFGGWGAATAVIGVLARVASERARRRTIGDQPARDRIRAGVSRALLAGTGIGVAIIAAGAWLVVGAGGDAWLAGAGGDAWLAGAGAAVIGQGAGLLGIDLLHARRVPPPGPLLPAEIRPHTGPGHEGFRLAREDGGGAGIAAGPVRGALLVHGFGGSPKELRGMAALLAADGWIVEVPRLPGHGAEFGWVADARAGDWVATVEDGAAALRELGVTQLLVAGHSVGASLALATASKVVPDALVLLAPFAWPVPRWQSVVGPFLRIVLPPGFRVFGRLDPGDPDARAGLSGLLPGIDLDDPAVVAGLRETRVPLTLLEQLFRVSAMAARAAPTVAVPVLAVQGARDPGSRPAQTRALLARLPGPPRVIDVDAGHDLVSEASPVREPVLAAVLAFAREVAGPR